MCKKTTSAMMIIALMSAVPAMADVSINVLWRNLTPNVNVFWTSQAGGIWTGAQGQVHVGYTAAGTSAFGQVTLFNTSSGVQTSNIAQFMGGTYNMGVAFSSTISSVRNFCYLETALSAGASCAVSQYFHQATPYIP